MKKFQIILSKFSGNYFVKLVFITLMLLLLAFVMLEGKTDEIAFIYNNF